MPPALIGSRSSPKFSVVRASIIRVIGRWTHSCRVTAKGHMCLDVCLRIPSPAKSVEMLRSRQNRCSRLLHREFCDLEVWRRELWPFRPLLGSRLRPTRRARLLGPRRNGLQCRQRRLPAQREIDARAPRRPASARTTLPATAPPPRGRFTALLPRAQWISGGLLGH